MKGTELQTTTAVWPEDCYETPAHGQVAEPPSAKAVGDQLFREGKGLRSCLCDSWKLKLSPKPSISPWTCSSSCDGQTQGLFDSELPVRAETTVRAQLYQMCGTGWPWGVFEPAAEARLWRHRVRSCTEQSSRRREGEEKVSAAWRAAQGSLSQQIV